MKWNGTERKASVNFCVEKGVDCGGLLWIRWQLWGSGKEIRQCSLGNQVVIIIKPPLSRR